MPRLHLRLATATDFDAIAEITNHYIATTAIHFGTEPVRGDQLRDLWRQHEVLYAWVVGEQGGEVLAYAKAGVWRSRAAYQWTPETGVYVRHDHLGEGLGRAVYERLLAVCKAQGFRSLVAGATMPNASSDRLHRELGFVPVGVVQQAGHKLGAWWDVAFYQLVLDVSAAAPSAPRSPADAWQALGFAAS